ncbi:hypothetical protein EI983_15675 [Roseovarius faecimaris]|uniref:APC family permease n=1 Tax=Roseovarius faecimaris TaxID=2494550 RepID=A0A6I6IW35_9RHOB|nr:hypothetical protein [Roseovarius faecimaris]QGX99626.1 hypothetical protein EI983_15675 [Roseovarius faecimaris]
MLSAVILFATLLAGVLLIHPRLSRATHWRATVTPLASIIGSGFLVLGPILHGAYGTWAPLGMVALCLLAYAFGAAIRFNIRYLDAQALPPSRLDGWGEMLADWVLAFAYVISVAYYLNLFGAFAMSLAAAPIAHAAELVTTGIFALILITGLTRGFGALEWMEKASVSLKLAIITGLLAGLAWVFAERSVTGALIYSPAQIEGWAAITLIFGLLVTVQGFETSRYLGDEYDAPTRIASMRTAQWISGAVYIAYALLLCALFLPDTGPVSETAIIGMMAGIDPVLPTLLIIAALSAQFSAAVADTGGSGGLLAELTRGRMSARMGYALLAAIGVGMTWTLSVFEIIGYASRAFALYYAMQALLAARRAWTQPRGHLPATGFFLLALLGLAIVALGTPVE